MLKLIFKTATAFLSEHRLKGRVKVPFCNALKLTTPATILPLPVLIEIIKSTYINTKLPLLEYRSGWRLRRMTIVGEALFRPLHFLR